MTYSWCLTVLGLTLNLAAAGLMYYYPPMVIRFTEKGEGEITLTSNATPEGQRAYQLYCPTYFWTGGVLFLTLHSA